MQSDDSMVVFVSGPAHETCCVSPINKVNRDVVVEQ
jgi:hypothetical protein